MREAARVLANCRNRKGTGSATARIHRHEEVRRVALRCAHIVHELGGNALDHVCNVNRVERLFRSVGRDAEGFAEQHSLRW